MTVPTGSSCARARTGIRGESFNHTDTDERVVELFRRRAHPASSSAALDQDGESNTFGVRADGGVESDDFAKLVRSIAAAANYRDCRSASV